MSEKKLLKSVEDLKVGDKVWLLKSLNNECEYEAGLVAEIYDRKGTQVNIMALAETHVFFEDELFNCWAISNDMIDWHKTNGYGRREDGLQIEYDPEYVESKLIVECKFDGEMLPTYGKEGDSALDLHAYKYKDVVNGELSEEKEFSKDGYILLPHERILVPTGLKLSIPEGYDADVRPRSGLTLKHGIVVQLGTLDNNYTGDCGMIVLNTSNVPYVISKGDRLGQLKFTKPVYIKLVKTDELKETNRGESGYGDSGK